MKTKIYAHSRAARADGSPGQAIECSRVLAVQQYRFLRRDGLSPRVARDRLFAILFIGTINARFVNGTEVEAA